MTRRDQTLRAWIERAHPLHNFISCVSCDGKAHKRSTGTRGRHAAREFNRLHTIEILFPTTTTHAQPHTQPELF